MSKRILLSEIDFGKRIAEEEVDAIESYFVETEQWRKVFGGEIDIVYGPKGSGKSAIYSLLLNKAQEFEQRDILVVRGENVMGVPVFRELVNDKSSSEDQLRGLWKLYFLSIIATTFRSRGIANNSAAFVINALEEAGLISPRWTLHSIFRSVRDYLRKLEIGAEVTVNPATGLPEGFGGKIVLGEPSGDQRGYGFISADQLLERAEEALAGVPLRVWIALDRLDVAFVDSEELEARALRSLFRTYLDMMGLRNISLKVFLRDDIWEKITTTGFREASHITKYTKIEWDPQSLLNLVIRRALHNRSLQEHYHVNPAEVLASITEQEKLFHRIFPEQVDSGAGKSSTFRWVLNHTKDGTKMIAPREVIHLISSARAQQLRLLETGSVEPDGETLIDRHALRAALPEVSSERFNQTLCAEHATLKPLMDRLEGEKTEQSAETLAKIWGVQQSEALANAERLAEIGFFEKRGTNQQPSFWVPFLYRHALNMVQGAAK